MTKLAEYLAELVNAGLKGQTPEKLPDDISIDRLIDIAALGCMNYILFQGLANTELPEEKAVHLKKRVRTYAISSISQMNEIRELEAYLGSLGIEHQLLKGAVMKYLYPAEHLREMNDIDIMVRDRDMDAVKAFLTARGYSLSKVALHHDVYVKVPFLKVEVHKGSYVSGEQDYFELEKEKLVRKEGTACTYYYNLNEFYIYMLKHMAKHFYTMGCGIRHLIDIFVFETFYKDKLDRSYIEKQLEAEGILTFAKHMETLSDIWLNRKESTEFYDQLFEYMLEGGLCGKDENGIWNKFAEENTQVTADQKKLYRWYLFPPKEYMVRYYPWLKKCGFLLPWAWCCRACRGIFLGKGSKKREMIKSIDQEKINIYKNIYQEMDLHLNLPVNPE